MNRRNIAVIVILAALLAGGFALYRRLKGAGNAGMTQYKLSTVDTGEVKKTVSATGTLQAWRTVDIKSRAGGEVKKLPVEVGTVVTKGQILAYIDPTDSKLAVNQAAADLESSSAKVQQADKTYQLQIQQSAISISDAQASLGSAIASRDAAAARLATAKQQSQAQPELTRTSIQQAQASLDQALRAREQLDATDAQQKASAKAAYDQAIANRDNSKAVLGRQKSLLDKGFVSQQTVDTAQADLTVQDAQVNTAKAKLDTLDAQLEADVRSADARVNQTKAALAAAKANSIDVQNKRNSVHELEASLGQAQAQVTRAQVALQQARANQANNAIRQYDIKTAGATVERNKASLGNAQTILDQTEVLSPSAGVVLQKYVEQGTIIQSGQSGFSGGTSIVQIGDISRMYVDVTVDETDIANVDEGQKVDVTFEAYPGVPFEGQVARVDPNALVVQNVTVIHVRVEVDNTAPTFRLLKPGMNATCQFVISKKDNVIRVPNEAIREDDNGKYVDVGSGGRPAPPDPQTGTPADPGALVDLKKEHRKVETGVEGNEMTEITTGLKPGEKVVTQTIEPAPPTAGGSPFGGGGFGGGGRGGGGFGGGGGGGRR